jgi:hemoglobin-like flavoprotein
MGSITGLIFYRRLFELDPTLRPLFKTDIEEQAGKLVEMLAALIGRLEQSERVTAELRMMGRRHAEYGVRSVDYGTVGEALLGMLGETLREGFSAPVKSAWEALYAAVTEPMLEGANDLAMYGNPASPSGLPPTDLRLKSDTKAAEAPRRLDRSGTYQAS